MKLEGVEITELKKKAGLNGLTVTDMLVNGLKDADRALYLEEQIKAFGEQIKEQRQNTGRKDNRIRKRPGHQTGKGKNQGPCT